MSHQTAIENYNKGLECSYRENWDEAVEYLKIAIEEDPAYVNAYNVLGKVYIQKGEIGIARECWRKALRFDPDNSTSRQCLKASGRFSGYLYPIPCDAVRRTKQDNVLFSSPRTKAKAQNWLFVISLVIFIAGLVITNITMLRRIGELETILTSSVRRDSQSTKRRYSQSTKADATIPRKSSENKNPASNIPEPTKILPPKESTSEPQIKTEYQLTEAYNKALKDCLSGNIPQAIGVFQQITEYPKSHSLKDNAQYWLGECYYHQKNYLQAISEFKRVKQEYPGSNKLFDAELKIAYTYYKLGRIDDAKSKIAQLHKDWPRQKYRSQIAILSGKIRDESLF